MATSARASNGRPSGNAGSPEKPGRLGARSWFGVMKRTFAEFKADNLTDWAAALTYYGVLAIFPAIIALISVLGLIGHSATQPLITNLGKRAPLLFIPFSVIGGIIAGALSKKTFEALWGIFDDHEAPEPEHRNVPLIKLISALVLQGAIFRAVRGLLDHGARRAFQRLTGSWPGDEQPEQA